MKPPLILVPPRDVRLCSNCLVELDDSAFCSLCGRVDTPAAARAFLLGLQAYAAGVRE